jgi:hypothetical protein
MENLLSIFNKPEPVETTHLLLSIVKLSTGEEITQSKKELLSEDLITDGPVQMTLTGF